MKRSEEAHQFIELSKRAGISAWAFIVPAVLALAASLFEGVSLALLIPTIQGMLERDFSFVFSLPVLGALAEVVFNQGEGRNFSLAVFLIGITFGVSVLQTACAYFASLRMAYQVQRFSSELRKLVHERYLSFGKLFFDRQNLGQLQQILTYNVGAVAGALKTIQGGFSAVCALGVYLVMMSVISWQLTAVVLFAFPLLRVSLAWLITRIGITSRRYSESYNELSRKISNSLMTISLVKSYCYESREHARFSELSDRVQALEYSIERKGLLVGPVQYLILLGFLFGLVSIIAFWVTRSPAEHIAHYAVFLLALKRAATQFGVFNQILSALAAVSGPMADIFRMFDDGGKYFVPEGSHECRSLRQGIAFQRLTFAYPDGIRALEDVSFEIEKGKLTAIVGATGSGKSTIINLLMRFYDVAPGSILIDGTDIRDLALDSWRARIALVSQDVQLFHESLKYNLTYGLEREVGERELFETLERAGLTELVATLPRGIDTPIGDRGVMLSGGERQRVSIARAILKNAEILILDEATSALDSTTEKLVQHSLDELIHGKTAVVIAHRLSTIRNADKVVVLEQGRVTEQGALEELLRKQGRFYSYWEDQRVI